jgi:integrase
MTKKKTQKLERGIRPWKGGLQAYIKVRGVQYSKDYDLNEPLETLRAWRMKTKRQHFGGVATHERGSFAADIQKYLKRVAAMPTITQRAAHLELWANALGRDRSRHSITTEEIDSVIQHWLVTPSVPDYAAGAKGRPSAADGIDPQTVRKRRTALQSFFETMNDRDKNKPNPVRSAQNFPPPDPEVRGTDYATIVRVLDAMPDYHSHKKGTPPTQLSLAKLRAAVMAFTGLAPELLRQVAPTALDLTCGTVRILKRRKGKGVEPRTIKLSVPAVAAFRALLAAHGLTRTWRTKPVNDAFKRGCKRAGVTGLTLYDLRHSFGAQVYRATKDLATVGRLLVHAKGSLMTARYAQAGDAEVDQAAVAAFTATLQASAGPRRQLRAATGSSRQATGQKLSRKAVPVRKVQMRRTLRKVG